MNLYRGFCCIYIYYNFVAITCYVMNIMLNIDKYLELKYNNLLIEKRKEKDGNILPSVHDL